MSSFWEKRGLVGPPQVTIEQPTHTSQVQPWWQSERPVQQQQVMPQQLVQQPQVAEYTTTKASASRKAGQCPECQSGNYLAMTTKNGDVERCYDCGYPVMQAFSGMSMPSLPGQNVTPTKQIEGAGLGGASNFHPNVIVGRA